MRVLRRLLAVIGLLAYFLYDLVVSSVRVAWDVVTPRLMARPRLMEMPLDARTDAEILMTANLISLTPGTLSMDVSENRNTLLVHAMFAGQDADATRTALKTGMERRVLEALR